MASAEKVLAPVTGAAALASSLCCAANPINVQNQTFLEETLQHAPFAVLIQRDSRIVFANHAATTLLGAQSAAELDGRSIFDIFHRDYHAVIAERVRGIFERGEKASALEERIVRLDGSTVDVEVQAWAFRHPAGPAAFVSLLDITDRKSADKALRLNAEELRLKNEELAAALIAAEEAILVKQQFFANVSHELRTPMNGLMGMMEVVLDSKLDAEQRDYLETALNSAKGLLRLLNDILDFSKLDAGKMTVSPAAFELSALVGESLRSVEQSAGSKNLALHCDIAPGAPAAVVADSLRIRQVLLNLVTNAIKFTEAGFVHVRCWWERDSQSQGMLHFSVEDTGLGLTPAQQNVIFEPFRQADGSTTRRYGGTGLGLTISKHLVEMMGGRLWVTSEPGRGSIFEFTIRADAA